MHRRCRHGPINSCHSFSWSNLILCLYNIDTLNICMKESGWKKIIFDKMTAMRTWTIIPFYCICICICIDIAFLGRSTPTTAIWWSNLILCWYNVDTLNICVEEFGSGKIIFVCTDSTETFSKLRSAGLNYNLPSFFTDSYCVGDIL